jgi:hypothetical protein
LNATTTRDSEIRDRSGGSETYVKEDGARVSSGEEEPVENPPREPEKAPKPAAAAARLLDAWDLNFLLILGWGSVKALKWQHFRKNCDIIHVVIKEQRAVTLLPPRLERHR